MGLPVEVNNLMLGSLGGYTVGRSLRFRSSATAYLNRTPASASNQRTWTWSAWVKRGTIGTNQVLFGAGTNGSSTNLVRVAFLSDSLQLYVDTGAANYSIITSAVYRDPSAWYHIVAVLDTTQATASSRMLLYVNGVQVTAFSTANYTPQNNTYGVNSTLVHNIGRYVFDGTQLFDGYLAEVNFIDGQALTPSSFGAYDTNGVWQPKKYTGTYGTNGFYLPFDNTSSIAGGNICTYSEDISNGAYVKNNATVTTNSTTAPNGTTTADTLTEDTANSTHRYYNPIGTTTNGVTYTFSVYAKANTRSAIALEGWNGSTVKTAYADLSNGTIISGSDASAAIVSVGNGWYRISVSHTGVGLSGSSIGVYLMNAASSSAYTYTGNGSGSVYLWGNQVEAAFSVGPYFPTQASTISSTLKIGLDSSTNASATSGYGNHWATNNISLTAGTTYDSMIDSPTNAAGTSTGIGNYATFNPLVKFAPNNSSYSSGNLGVQQTGGASGSHACAISTIAMSSGKWYAEFSDDTATYDGNRFGILNINNLANYTNANPYVGWASDGYVIYKNSTNAVKENNGSSTNIGSNWTAGAIISVAVDIDNSKIWWRVNGGAWFGGGDPAAGTSPVFTIASGNTYAFAVSPYNNNGVSANFGQRPFTYTPPSGFKALNTYNLPAPSIANGAQYMAATTYTGNNSTNTINNGNNTTNATSFQPDMVWIKSRSSATNHMLDDSVRGVGKDLFTNLTSAESTTNIITSFNSNGFTLGPDGGGAGNGNALTYVAWQWKGGGTAVTNNSGTISSQVSANTSAGISIITWTGNATAGATVGHGLGVAPDLIITKNRDSATDWWTYHSSLGATKYIVLNSTAAAVTSSAAWNNTAPTSSVFSLGSSSPSNANRDVAYCFSAVRGYSAFGSYTGNGSADGPFIYTGFRPRFIMIKNATAVNNWGIIDTSRDTYNGAFTRLHPNLSQADNTGAGVVIDVLSNGFKCRNSDALENQSGQTIIYAAFAEHPFNYSRAR